MTTPSNPNDFSAFEPPGVYVGGGGAGGSASANGSYATATAYVGAGGRGGGAYASGGPTPNSVLTFSGTSAVTATLPAQHNWSAYTVTTTHSAGMPFRPAGHQAPIIRYSTGYTHHNKGTLLVDIVVVTK